MTTPPNPTSSGDDRNLVPVDATNAVAMEDKLHLLWRKYGGLVLGACIAVLLAILGKGIWEYLQGQKHAKVGQAYAAASTPEQLKSFASENAGHSLASVAHVRIGDEAYAAGKWTEAIAAYNKALEAIENGPLAARVKIGRALAKVQTGQNAEGIDELKQISEDAGQLDSVRAEAAYHLASISAEAGNVGDAQKYIAQVSQTNPDPRANPWMSRAMALQMSLPRTTEPTPSASGATNSQSNVETPSGSAPITVPIK